MLPLLALGGCGAVQHRAAHRTAECAAAEIFKFHAFEPPDIFQHMHGCAPWFGVALLELMNRALRQTDMRTELALAPAENSARRSDFRGKAEPLHPDQLEKLS